MDPEIKKLLEETHALSKDNHRMLKAIRRDQWVSFFARIIIWAVVLLLPLYLYQQYVQPFVSKIVPAASSTSSGYFGLPSTTEIQKVLNSYKTGQP